MARKIHHDLHIPFEKLGELLFENVSCLAIDGASSITRWMTGTRPGRC